MTAPAPSDEIAALVERLTLALALIEGRENDGTIEIEPALLRHVRDSLSASDHARVEAEDKAETHETTILQMQSVINRLEERLTAERERRERAEARVAELEASSCLMKRRTGEPFFVLLGRDAQAPDAIRHWAHERKLAEGESPKIGSAYCTADEMDRYRAALTPETNHADA